MKAKSKVMRSFAAQRVLDAPETPLLIKLNGSTMGDGLRQALVADWRGGVGGKVISGGVIAVGDQIRIEA